MLANYPAMNVQSFPFVAFGGNGAKMASLPPTLSPPRSPHHHLAHLCSTVVASLRKMADEPRRQLRRRTRALLDLAALSETVVMLALYYLRRASQLTPSPDEEADVFCVAADQQVLAALVCAQKYHEDAAYTNRTWSDLSGVEISQINRLERNLLIRLRHELCVDPQEFSRWSGEVRRWASLNTIPTSGLVENNNNVDMKPLSFHLYSHHHAQCACATCASLNFIHNYQQWSPPQLTQVVMHMPVSMPSYAPYYAVPFQMPNMVTQGIWAMPSA